ncbi:thioesterase family protein [Nocardioides sp. KR10-350]|uniref:thioesterase family protein n=1 Tax=Nocardioides cheoyonin TaxID=3156615 RepID=UPI0032B5A1A9
MPTYSAADIVGLVPAMTIVMPPEYEDHNGHVNVRHYYDLHMRAADVAFEEWGIDPDYLRRTNRSVFSVEHHIAYLSEVVVGDRVSLYVRLFARSAKVVHGMSVLVDDTSGLVANTVEFVEAHVDLTSRRASPFGDDVAAALDEAIAAHSALPWSLPLAGRMGATRQV